MCEGKDLDEKKCSEGGCCRWDGKCFSDVGDGECVKKGEEFCHYTHVKRPLPC